MKSNRGVTLASLTIYVIVTGIVLVMLAFLNVNFFQRISDLTAQTSVTNEYSKFCSYFLKDLKSSDRVLAYDSSEIEFSNGAKYEIKKKENTPADKEDYMIYRNGVEICDSIIGQYLENNSSGETVDTPFIDYDFSKNTVTMILYFSNRDSYSFESQQTYQVGKGY